MRLNFNKCRFAINALALLAISLLAGCKSNDTEITEMHVDNAGILIQGDSYTRDELWMRQVNETISNESHGEKPPDGITSWEQFWHATYSGIRAQPKPAWRSSHFKTSEGMVAYIKQQRTTKKLPLYDER